MKIGRVAGVVIAAGFVGFVAYSLLWSEPVKVLHPHLQHSADGAFVSGRGREYRSSARIGQPRGPILRCEEGVQMASDTVQMDRLEQRCNKRFRSSQAYVTGRCQLLDLSESWPKSLRKLTLVEKTNMN